jgi:pyruvate kinase
MVQQVNESLLRINRATVGEKVVLAAGLPPGQPGTLNGLRVVVLGRAQGGI